LLSDLHAGTPQLRFSPLVTPYRHRFDFAWVTGDELASPQ